MQAKSMRWFKAPRGCSGGGWELGHIDPDGDMIRLLTPSNEQFTWRDCEDGGTVAPNSYLYAAPDLLAACKAAEAMIESILEHGIRETYSVRKCRVDLTKVIARAEGGAE